MSATNAFAGEPDPGDTNTQAGFTLGGPLQRSRTFFFTGFDTSQENSTGFRGSVLMASVFLRPQIHTEQALCCSQGSRQSSFGQPQLASRVRIPYLRIELHESRWMGIHRAGRRALV